MHCTAHTHVRTRRAYRFNYNFLCLFDDVTVNFYSLFVIINCCCLFATAAAVIAFGLRLFLYRACSCSCRCSGAHSLSLSLALGRSSPLAPSLRFCFD